MNDGGVDKATLQLKNLEHIYTQGRVRLRVLCGVSLMIQPGEIVALTGPSGAGKSTLLHIAGLLEKPTEGHINICGQACDELSDQERTALRRSEIGFVYQFHHLLPEFSALENIVVPQLIDGQPKSVSRERALSLLELVGLTGRATHRPGELSGGEQQRVAIARAFANRPGLLLADEPTGNLDEKTAIGVYKFLSQVVATYGVAALIATHNMELASAMDRQVRLHDGTLQVV